MGSIIPLSARIVALADALDAMISRDPIVGLCKICEALKEVYKCAGSV